MAGDYGLQSQAGEGVGRGGEGTGNGMEDIWTEQTDLGILESTQARLELRWKGL